MAPVTVPASCTYTTIAGGAGFQLAVKADGTAWGWGFNFAGQLGNGTSTDSSTPVQVAIPGARDVVAVSAGTAFGLALRRDGTVWAWGGDTRGDTGLPAGSPGTLFPHQVASLSGIVAIAAGSIHGVALSVDGTVWAWGDNSAGQLGNGTTDIQTHDVPSRVGSLSSIATVKSGRIHSLAITQSGTLWAWGDNFYGQIGDGTTTSHPTPIQVSGLSGVKSVAGGRQFTLAVDGNGDVWTWGANFSGQLGDGTQTNRPMPAKINLTGVQAVASGVQADFSLAQQTSGQAWAWGQGFHGELGNGGNASSSTPVQVSLPPAVTELAAGQQQAMGLLSDDTFWGWGSGTYVPTRIALDGVAQPGHCAAPPPPPSPGPTPPSQVGGGSPSAPPPSPCQHLGSPVNCSTGEFWHRFADLSVKGHGLGLELSHTYSSSLAGQDGPLGFGWTHSYNMGLTFNGDGSANVREEGGSVLTFAPDGSGGYIAPRWVFATFVKNGDGSYTLRRTNQTSFTFNASGQLSQEQDRNGYADTLTYTGGQLGTVTDAGGRPLKFQYSGTHLVKVTDPIQRAVAFQYDPSGNLVSISDVGGGVTRLTYDANHLLVTMTDPNGGVLKNQYDAAGRVSSQTDAMGRTTAWSYADGVTTIMDPKGNAIQETYKNGQLASLTQAFGTSQAATTAMTYDPQTFTLTSTTDANNHTTSYTSDASGNPLTVTDPLGRKSTVVYDSLNNPITATAPSGITTQVTYDGRGNPTSVSRQLNATSAAVTSFTYDPANAGDLVALKDPDGNTYQFMHDQYGDIVRAVDPLANVVTYSYDAVSRLSSMVSANGNAPGAVPAKFLTSYSYNAFDDATAVTDPLGHVTTYTYDVNRNQTSVTDAKGRTTSYAYDADNEPLSGKRADGALVQNVYDAAGRIAQQIDALGKTITYGYDALQRLISITDPLGRATTINHDSAGNVTSIVDPVGRTTSYAHDAADQLTGITYSDAKTPKVGFSYDLDGRRLTMTDGTGTTSYTYDSLGRLTQSVDGSGKRVGYGYDLRGDLTALVYPDSSRVTRAFDANGRLTSVSDWLANKTSFGYDANGNLTAETYPNGVRSARAFDAANQLTQITYAGPMGQLALTQGRDPLGQLTSEQVAGSPPNGPISYGYDQANRQTSADFGIVQLAYQYDLADRLTQVKHTSGSKTSVAQLSYDAADQLISLTTQVGSSVVQKLTFGYDGNGNRVQNTDAAGKTISYGFDQANRLISAAGTASYSYNGDGLRVSKTVNGVSQAFTWAVAGQMPVLIQDGATRYVTGPEGLPLEQIRADGTIRYYLQDALGSTRALTDAKGQLDSAYLYDPYGNLLAFTGSPTRNPFQYAGQYVDAETGFVYLRARYYDPTTAQFLSKDPVSSLIGHPYAYGGDSPLNATDPTGLIPWQKVWNILGPHLGLISALTGAVALGLSLFAVTGAGAVFSALAESVSLVTGALAAVWACTNKMDFSCGFAIAGTVFGGFSFIFKGLGEILNAISAARGLQASAAWASDAFILWRALQWIGLKTLQGIYWVFAEMARALANVWAGLAVAFHTVAAVAEYLQHFLEAGVSPSGPATPAAPALRPAPC